MSLVSFVAPLLLATSAPLAPSDGDVVLTLAAADRFYDVARPARIRLTIENRGRASFLMNNGVLFGQGLQVAAADGVVHEVKETAVPANAKQNLLLPAGATVTSVVDLAPLAPQIFEKRGPVKVGLALGELTAPPLDLEIHPDWRGWHAVIESSLGEMELEFFPERAPITVANFLELAEADFYDGLSFHRVVKGFMVQGGCPHGDGTGDGPKTIPLEAERGPDALKHLRGTISMAHKADPNSGSCQFFLCHRDQIALNGAYSAFGRIVRGLETLDRIADVPCAIAPGGPDTAPSRPKERVEMKKIRLVPPAPGAVKPGGSGG